MAQRHTDEREARCTVRPFTRSRQRRFALQSRQLQVRAEIAAHVVGIEQVATPQLRQQAVEQQVFLVRLAKPVQLLHVDERRAPGPPGSPRPARRSAPGCRWCRPDRPHRPAAARREIADLVERDRAAVRFLEIADAAPLRAHECAGLVAEQLALRKPRVDRAAVDRDERARAAADMVDMARDQLLAVPVSPRISAGGTVDDTGIRPRV